MAHAREVAENLQASQADAVETPWWRRTWHAITHPGETFQSALIALGRRSPLDRKAIEAIARALWSLNDPQRNPAVAGLGEALRQGWAGLSFATRATWDLARATLRAWWEGDRIRTRQYARALWQGLWDGWMKQSVYVAGHLLEQAINPKAWWETVETWWQAVQDWRAGKRGLWDVVFTTANVAALVLGLYMGGRVLYRQVTLR